MKSAVLVVLPFTFWLSATSGLLAANETSPRQVVALDGVWSVAEGRLEEVPASFDRAVPVPGLAATIAEGGVAEGVCVALFIASAPLP